MHVSSSSDTPLKADGVYLYQLQDSAGGRDVFAAVRTSAPDDEGNAVGSVVDYVSKSARVKEDVFFVFAKRLDVLATLSGKTKVLVLRYLDRQGAP